MAIQVFICHTGTRWKGRVYRPGDEIHLDTTDVDDKRFIDSNPSFLMRRPDPKPKKTTKKKES